MGNSGVIDNSDFKQKFDKHQSLVQRKPKMKLTRDNPLFYTWVNPLELVYLIILDFTIRKGGIGHQELVDKTIQDSKTVRKHERHLAEEGLVKRVNNRYKAIIDNDKAGLLREAAMLMNFDIWGRLDLLPSLKQYYKHFNTKSQTDVMLLNLANQMGAFVIYTLIESMNSKNHYLESEKLNGRLSSLWFEKVISSDVEYLLQRFRKIMLWTINYPTIPIGDINSDDIILSVDDISVLRTSLRNIYPDLMAYFDQLKEHIPKKLEEFKAGTLDAIYSEMNFQNQDVCKHENTINIKDKNLGYYLKECTNCHMRWKNKKMNIRR